MIPLYGFLEGDTIGLLILADEADTVATLIDKLQTSARVRVEPRKNLKLLHNGQMLDAEVTFDYGGLRVAPGSATTAFDADRRRLIRRDSAFEQAALTRLSQLGFSRHWDYMLARQHLWIGADQFSNAMRVLIREGWRVEAEGRTFRTAQSMRTILAAVSTKVGKRANLDIVD